MCRKPSSTWSSLNDAGALVVHISSSEPVLAAYLPVWEARPTGGLQQPSLCSPRVFTAADANIH